MVHFKAISLAKQYLMLRESIYVNRQRKSSVSRSPNLKSYAKSIESMPLIVNEIEKIFYKLSSIREDRFLKEQCVIMFLGNRRIHLDGF